MHNVRKINKDLYWVGSDENRLALFENIHPLPEGVSYNSYLLLDEKTVLFDTVDWAVARQYFDNIAHVLGGRKLGGMLTELHLDGERLAYAVLGLGINVNVAFDGGGGTGDRGEPSTIPHPPPDLADAATDLSSVSGRPVDRLALLAAILGRCEAWYDRLLGGESPHRAWAARLDTLGRRVTVTTAAGAWGGLATGVTPEGALLVQDEAGCERVVWSGDVTALRAAA